MVRNIFALEEEAFFKYATKPSEKMAMKDIGKSFITEHTNNKAWAYL